MKTSGILLASGASKRLGKPKQLLDWDGIYLINFVINKILESNINELVVVLGCLNEKILSVIDKRPNIVINEFWDSGKSTSIKIGLSKISKVADTAIFFTVDQPFIDKSLINEIIDIGVNSSKEIVASSVKGILTIPVLYKKGVFKMLNDLQGDMGGKLIIEKNKNNLYLVEWGDERLLLDIDTEEDYQFALKQI